MELPDAGRVEAWLRRQDNWRRGDELAVVRVRWNQMPSVVARLGLYRRGKLVGLIRETRGRAFWLDAPLDEMTYEREAGDAKR